MPSPYDAIRRGNIYVQVPLLLTMTLSFGNGDVSRGNTNGNGLRSDIRFAKSPHC